MPWKQIRQTEWNSATPKQEESNLTTTVKARSSPYLTPFLAGLDSPLAPSTLLMANRPTHSNSVPTDHILPILSTELCWESSEVGRLNWVSLIILWSHSTNVCVGGLWRTVAPVVWCKIWSWPVEVNEHIPPIVTARSPYNRSCDQQHYHVRLTSNNYQLQSSLTQILFSPHQAYFSSL